MENSQLIASTYSALKTGALLSIFATHTVSAIAAPECDQDAYERKIAAAITCERLGHEYRKIVDRLNAVTSVEPSVRRVSTAFLEELTDWWRDYDRSISAEFWHFRKECQLSAENKETITLVFHRWDFQMDWDFDVTLDIEDADFRLRKIVPSQQYLRSESALDLAVRSFAETLSGSALAEMFADGGFSIESRLLAEKNGNHYRISSTRDECRLIDSIYNVDGLLSSIYTDSNDLITKIY